MNITRRKFLYQTSMTLTGLLLSSCSTSNRKKSSRNSPNVVFIKSDEHNPFISGPYGHPFIQTPNMDILASIGTVYENSYCNSPLCMPSRSSFMAGRYPFEIFTNNNSNVIEFDYPSHGKILNDHGIYTTIVGKVDVYQHSSKLGFNEVLLPFDRERPGDMNIVRNPLQIREKSSDRQYGYGVDNTYIRDEGEVGAAVNWIHTRAVQLDTPWYLEVNIHGPHFPHLTTEQLWQTYKDHDDLPEYGVDEQTAQHPYMQDLRDHFQTESFTEQSVRGLRRGYYGCVTQVDRHIGKIIQSLKTEHLLDNTIIIYTSDHGEMLGKFGLWWKCTLLEDSVRVPLMIAGPGVGINKRFKSSVDQLDLQATLFDIFNIPMPKERRGRSLLNREDDYENTVVFSEYQGHGTRGSAFMVRKGDYKYIWYHDAPCQLFNLSNDPDEMNNLAAEIPKKVEEMDRILRSFCDPAEEQKKAEKFIQRQLAAAQQIR